MKVLDVIIEGLSVIQEEAKTKEDGNTHALVQRVVRDLASLGFHYASLRMTKKPAEKKLLITTEETKFPENATTEAPKPIENSTADAPKEPTASKSRASS